MTSTKIPGYLQKKTHLRAVLMLCAAVFVFLGFLLLSFVLQLHAAQRSTLASQASSADIAVAVDAGDGSDTTDTTTPTQSVFAPNLVALLGLDQETAIAQLGHGATLTEMGATYDSAGMRHARLTVTLSSEPADKLAGTPTVYLTLSDDGLVIEAGYRAGMAYLGYGSLSFVDALENAHVVENTLTEAGLTVPEGSVSAPQDRSNYSTYGSDGVTLVSEEYEFSGNDSGHDWRALLSYDYRTANSTGNLANTVRVVSVYVHA